MVAIVVETVYDCKLHHIVHGIMIVHMYVLVMLTCLIIHCRSMQFCLLDVNVLPLKLQEVQCLLPVHYLQTHVIHVGQPTVLPVASILVHS